MMKHLLALVISCLASSHLIAQVDTLKIAVRLPTKGIVAASLDRQGNCYLADSSGSLSKYDSDGKLLAVYQPRQVMLPDLLESWNGLNVFQFYKQQRILYLDRFLTGDEPVSISANSSVFAAMAAPSQDGKLWVWDLSDFSLKKLDNSSGNEVFSNPLNLVFKQAVEVSFMREYENRLYVADTAGFVHTFDNAGSLLKSIKLGVRWVSFYGENMIYTKSDTLFQKSLYTNEESKLTDKNFKQVKYCFFTSKVIFVVARRQLIIFKRP